MWELDHKEGWVPKNWCFQPVVLKTLESPLYYKEIKPDNSKWNQWILIGRTDVEVEASVLWPPALKSRVTRKDPDAGKDWRQEQKGAPEDDTVRWHPWFNRHEFEQAPGDGERQGNLVCCSPWGHKEWDTAEWLNKSNLRKGVIYGERGWYWESVQPLGSGSQHLNKAEKTMWAQKSILKTAKTFWELTLFLVLFYIYHKYYYLIWSLWGGECHWAPFNKWERLWVNLHKFSLLLSGRAGFQPTLELKTLHIFVFYSGGSISLQLKEIIWADGIFFFLRERRMIKPAWIKYENKRKW